MADFFLAGCSKYSGDTLGWAGHTKQGDIFSNVSGQNLNLLCYSCSSILCTDVLARAVSDAHTLLKSVIVLGTQIEGRFEQDVTSFAKSNRLSYPHNCLTLDLNGALTPEQCQHADMITFNFDPDKESSVEVAIEDRLSALERDNPEAKRGFLGPVIEHKLDIKTFTKYMLLCTHTEGARNPEPFLVFLRLFLRENNFYAYGAFLRFQNIAIHIV